MINKVKTTSFWLGISGAIVMILDSLSNILGVELYSKDVEEVILGICTVLVTLGIITKKSEKDKDISKDILLEDINNKLTEKEDEIDVNED